MKNISLSIFLSLGVVFGCVPYPGMQSATYQMSPKNRVSFGALGAGAANAQSAHFFVKAYGQGEANKISNSAETIYNRLMIDASLLNFQAPNGFKLVVYQNQDEFAKKTGQPSGSRGVLFRGALYTYADPMIDQRLSYEITRLILSKYINRPNPDWIWIQNGLAAYEEIRTIQEAGNQRDLFALVHGQVIQNPLPLSELTTMPPPDDTPISNSAWNCQSESMIAFMLSQGGNSQFGQFLAGLRSNQDISSAISQGFPGKWNGLSAFYQAWLQRG
jgi:hypothetical protein